MDLVERLIYWLEIHERQCEERDLLNDAVEEIERLRCEVARLSLTIDSEGRECQCSRCWRVRKDNAKAKGLMNAAKAAGGGRG